MAGIDGTGQHITVVEFQDEVLGRSRRSDITTTSTDINRGNTLPCLTVAQGVYHVACLEDSTTGAP